MSTSVLELFNNATNYGALPKLQTSARSSYRNLIQDGRANTNALIKADGTAGTGQGKQTFAFGSANGSDTLATLKVADMVISQYGLDLVDQAIRQLLEAYNRIVAEMIAQFCDVTGDKTRRYGTSALMSMTESENYGIPFAQTVTSGYTVQFPLQRAIIGLQWNRHYANTATTQEIAMQLEALLVGDARWIQAKILNALFSPTSYGFQDFMTDGEYLLIKALANAESGLQLPVGPQGEIFGATHNHFMYPGSGNGDTLATYTSNAWNATPTTASMILDVQNVINNLLEHTNSPTSTIKLLINRQQEVQFRQLTPTFTPLYDPNVIHSITIDVARGALDVASIADRAIGLFDGAEVWVKPYIPAGYMLAYLEGDVEPALAVRVPNFIKDKGSSIAWQVTLSGGDLRVLSEFEMAPFYAQAAERNLGIGVWNRVNGVAVYLNSTSAYTNPAPFSF